ncbi:alpha/beta-hydrolase [Schizophyllum commune Loenen D]|nr:alpha/beta-hydrolase [Schizophyllum commune Loenen D]
MAGILSTGLSLFACLGLAQAVFIPHSYTHDPHAHRSTVVPRASSGCGTKPRWAFDNSGHFTENTLIAGNQRTYLVHVPNDFNNAVPRPLVLSFHGADGTSQHQEDASQLSLPGQTIAGRSIVAVYPQGLPGDGRSAAWDAAPYADPDAHDVEFTTAILDDVISTLCIDVTRIYISGKSNGGGFTNRLACTPEINRRVAAFGLASGAYYPQSLVGDACKPGRPIPIILTHGDADTTVPYHGKPNNGDSTEPDIDNFVEDWAGRNGYSFVPTTHSKPHDNTNLWAWGGFGAPGQVKRYRVTGMGHIWPTTVVGSDKEGLSAPFNLTQQDLLPFFEQYTL